MNPVWEFDSVDGCATTKAVTGMTGASYRQLDYWARTDLVGPKGNGSGSRRRWTRNDVAVVRVVVAMVGAGTTDNAIDGHMLRAAVAAFRAAGHPDHGWLVVHRDRAVFVPIEKALASTIRSVGAALVVDLGETAAAAVASSDDPSPLGRSAAGEASGVAAPTVPVPGRRVVAGQHRPPDPRQIAGDGGAPVSQMERAAAIGAVTPAAAR